MAFEKYNLCAHKDVKTDLKQPNIAHIIKVIFYIFIKLRKSYFKKSMKSYLGHQIRQYGHSAMQ